MLTFWSRVLTGLVIGGSVLRLWAGGSGLNVAVVVNQASTNSVELGNYYCERRQVPPQNLLRINWTGGISDWTLDEFNSHLLFPLQAMLSARALTNQVDYVVLSMDIPYRVTSSSSLAVNSTTASLFYGFKPDPNPECSLAPGSANAYAGSEAIFGLTPPIEGGSNAFLVTMITASNLPLAKLVVDQGVASDGTQPAHTVFLTKGTDVDRNVRFLTFDNAIFNTRLRGDYRLERINSNWISYLGEIFGAQTGTYSYTIDQTSFSAGAMADNLTSFGGMIFTPNGSQLNILSLLAVGATGTYGTVDEPCAYLEKFPSPQNYFYQARGFSLAECYYQSLTNPYQGLILGEPLAQPFARPATGAWLGLPKDSLLSGTTNLSLQCTAADPLHPVQQVDLFVDGNFAQTLTNIAPGANCHLQVTINGQPMDYAVPYGATLGSIALDLTTLLNNNSNLTQVMAATHGDRLELSSLDPGRPGSQVSLFTSNTTGTAAAPTVFVSCSRTDFLDTIAFGRRNFQLAGTIAAGDSLSLTITKTNGDIVTASVTNNSAASTLSDLAQQLVAQINSDSELTAADGLQAQDFLVDALPPDEQVEFNVVANSAGWGAAGVQVNLSGTSQITVTPSGNLNLDQNLADLQPRNHLYLTAGVTNLSLTFPLDTTALPDGVHELTAVVYEGSHVRTQKRIAQTVRLQNGTLAATLTPLLGDTNTAIEATIELQVTANTNDVAQIQLFSTGGLLSTVSNQASTVFAISGASLGLGLHPFYAQVTDRNGHSFRTDTKWIRFVGAEPPFSIRAAGVPAGVEWTATAGRRYDILRATNLPSAFIPIAQLTPTNCAAHWTDTNLLTSQVYYRIRSAN